ncbi:MAG: tyrosine-type recombinase/integrase [Nitrospirota bacterium]
MDTKHVKRTQAKRLNADSLASLPVGTYGDPAQECLEIRVRKKAVGFSRTWLMRFKFRTKESRITLGRFPETSLATARRMVQELREKATQGIDPRKARPRRNSLQSAGISPESGIGEKHDPHSIEGLCSTFMTRHVRPSRKRPEYAQRILNASALKHWKGRDARTITPAEVLEVLDAIVDSGSPVMANRTAALLGQLFKYGIHRRIVADTPVKLLYRPGGKEKSRERTLTDTELNALLSLQPPERWERFHHAINLLLLTGLRRSEMALGSWKEIDFPNALWVIPGERTKPGKAHAVPLSDWVIEELRALKREAEGSPWLFPSEEDHKKPADPKLLTRNMARAQSRFQKQHSIGGFTLHDLRRTCRTGLSKLKVQPHVAERVLGHAQEKIAGTYDLHDYLEEKREALEKWAEHLKKISRSA